MVNSEKEKIPVFTLTVAELEPLVKQWINECLAYGHETRTDTPPRFLSRKEAAKLLQITLPTLHVWTRRGLVKGNKIGTRVLYAEADIQAALVEIPARPRLR